MEVSKWKMKQLKWWDFLYCWDLPRECNHFRLLVVSVKLVIGSDTKMMSFELNHASYYHTVHITDLIKGLVCLH